MKRIAALITFVFFASMPALYSQGWHNARKDDKLKGPVKSCVHSGYGWTISSVYQKDGKMKYYEYETDSRVTEEYYDDQGRRISTIETSKKYDDVYKAQYTYQNGQVTRRSTYGSSSSTESYPQTRYNSFGLPVKKYSDSDSWISYEYDSKGNLTQRSHYENGELKSYITMRYDSNGRKVEHKSYKGNKLKSRETYKYSGNTVESKIYDENGNLCSEASYVKDNMGNIIEYFSVNLTSGNKTTYTAVYYYDSYGNWVYKKINQEDPYAEFRKTSSEGLFEERREITYY
jgi:antitoxin component YwqK of YwqJK toxin-antitoxin module